MIVKPMIRNNLCLNAHPAGCKKSVENQIEYTKTQKKGAVGPKNVLVIGCSNGYGLASRIVAGFGYGATTIGVSLEKAGSATKGGTPGWYNNEAFSHFAQEEKLTSITIDGDAFSDSIKKKVIQCAKTQNITFDLVVYSLASPVRTDPETAVQYKSVLKPFGKAFSGKTIDPFTSEIKEITAEPATKDEEIATIKVMGGEDWARWIIQLQKAEVLSQDCMTIAYSYIGPEVTQALYRNGTIGKAKEHLEKTAYELTDSLKNLNGKAFVSVNKGLVTRSSAIIPVIPLYLSSLFRIMKEKGTHEGCVEQINRLFSDRLYTEDGILPTDSKNRIRIDDLEMDEDTQKRVTELMSQITHDNAEKIVDLAGYRHDFLATCGFDIAGIDYEAETKRFDCI